MKITYLALHLGYGGIERSIIDRANLLSEKYDVEILVTYKLHDEPVFKLSPKVKVKYLTKLKPNKKELMEAISGSNIFLIAKEFIFAFNVLLKRRSSMIKEIKSLNNGVVISTRMLFTGFLSKYGSDSIIKVAEEHEHHNYDAKHIERLKKACINIDYLLPVSKELTHHYAYVFKNEKIKVKYIPHFLNEIPVEKSKLNNYKIISIARLSPEKGFLDLIDVFKLVNEELPNASLTIAGDGLQMKNIKNKINSLGLNEKVSMLGFINQKKLNKELFDSSLYVMTSFRESFGLVLLEAMSFGIPCIGFDSAQGASEIIENNFNGYLISNRDIVLMKEKIVEYFIQDNKQSLADNAIKTALKFSKDKIKGEWLDFMENIEKVNK